LCSSCGGGSTLRTGKWRPKQMFEAGRKTCSLSHVRVGNPSGFRVITYRIPVKWPALDGGVPNLSWFQSYGDPMDDGVPFSGLPPDEAITALATSLSKFSEETYIHTWDAISMLTTRGLTNDISTWNRLKRSCDDETAAMDRFMRGAFSDHVMTHPGPILGCPVRRYISVLFFPRPKRRRGNEDRVQGGDAGKWIIGSALAYQWNIRDRHLYRYRNTSKVHASPKVSLLPYVLGSCLRGIGADLVADPRLLPPLHTSAPFPLGTFDTDDARAMLYGMFGVRPIDEYLREVGPAAGDSVRFLLENDFVREEGFRKGVQFGAMSYEACLAKLVPFWNAVVEHARREKDKGGKS
ncbi:hypothetical protein HK101_005370, partial [Irineochytrium annulatum]